VRLVDEVQHPLLQPGEGGLGYALLKLLGLEIASREQRHEILQLAALELRGKGDAEHVRVGRVIDVIVFLSYPGHLLEKLRGGKSGVVVFDLVLKVGRN